jgi:SulP family sulfate permease
MPDQELIGLGAANVGAAFTGGYPVTGGFRPFGRQFRRRRGNARRRRLHRGGLLLAALLLTPLIYNLPQATLAATIIVAVLSLVDFSILKKTWTYSRADFAAVTPPSC